VASQNTEFVAEDNLKVYFIDVGQADSILVVNKDQTMLIDAGGNEKGKEVVEFIQSKGITKLNYVIGTHPHEDHIGGLDDVINSFDIENILMPKMQTNTKTFEDVLDAINNKGLKITSPQKGNTFNIGDAKCEIMTDSISDESNLNLSSIIIRLEFGNKSFLFMGDAETKNENTITWDKVDVLKVGHHGSTTSSSKKFLNQVKPEIAIIMVGKDNSYNLPKDEIVTRLQNVGASIYRTDENGTILIETDGNNISVDKSK
jgi:competence protein ComEC